MKNIIKTEGVTGLYRGGSLASVKGGLGSLFFFTGLENASVLTKYLINYSPDSRFIGLINFLNAGIAKFASTALMSPINVMKTRFEVAGNADRRFIGSFVDFYRKNGFRALYSGLIPTLMRDIPYSGLQYTLYRWMLDLVSYDEKLGDNKNARGKIKISTAAFLSSVVAILITYPFDNIRVRFQCNDLKNASESVNTNRLQIIREAYLSEGLAGFYQGYLPRILKKGFSSVVTWILYESLHSNKYRF
eukprot:TRINITY_DN10603_c0_g1_i2.p1 TRINITY_DN10603_c0_g1~~TRINITY_DN10603_c0_g1_i2.p1  ORF type:complete len:247 (+),score=25.69 TRINITY_DN10603_c0_g1_i2:297-1037(+)